MPRAGSPALALLGVLVTGLVLGGCEKAAADRAAPARDAVKMVGYDLRRLKPRNEEPLVDMFERVRTAAIAEGKRVAVLFSANWCEACRMLRLELGNTHPADIIGDVRIVEIIEEDWEAVTRIDEFNSLSGRYYPMLNSYPIFVMLDAEGKKVEEMREGKDRLEGLDVEATVPNWFQSLQ